MERPNIGDIVYSLNTTRKSSEYLGACEVCGKHASEVFIQSAKRCYRFDSDGKPRWTHHKAPETLFGHDSCLKSKQHIKKILV